MSADCYLVPLYLVDLVHSHHVRIRTVHTYKSPIGIGLFLWLIGPLAAFELKLPYLDRYVFALPFTTIVEKFKPDAWLHQLLSLGYAIVFFTIALFQFTYQRR